MPAKKARGKAAETEKPKASPNRDLVSRARDRFKIMADADRDNRTKAVADLKFLNVPGEQWDVVTRNDRGDRPCYEFNKLRITAKRIINDMRANRPQGKVRAVEDGDKDTADIYEGLIRNIWNVSDGDTVIDNAAEYQVGGGFGAWRISTDYAPDSVSNQDIKVEGFKNPLCVYHDPSVSDPMARDAEDWAVSERMPKKKYEARWPDREKIDFGDTEFDDADWRDEETVRICEYWYREPAEKRLLLTDDGKTVDAASLKEGEEQQLKIAKERVVKCHKIMMCIIGGGDELLDPPSEWAGSMFPFVPVYGERMVIDGKTQWHGITRFAKDAQRAYNSARTAISEKVSMALQAQYWATADQAKGHMEKWNEAHRKLFPALIYNADGKVPGPPQRMAGADVPVALIQESEIASEEIKAVTGIFDNSLGQQGNETSGKAITARERQGQIATYNYMDNMGKAIRRSYEIIIDLLPKIYDTERSVRILGQDMVDKYEKVNQSVIDPETGQPTVINDLSRGKYDVTVTTGPSFATQRQEASETFTNLASSFPPLMQIAGDLVFKSMDVPLSEEFAERMKMMLPPEVQQQLADGKAAPPEAMAAMQQANQAMQVVQQKEQLLRQAASDLEKDKSDAEKAKADVEKVISQLEAKKAQFDAHVAKEMAGLQGQQSQLEVKGAQLQVKDAQSQAREGQAKNEQDQSTVQQATEQAVGAIQQLAEQFVQSAGQVLQQLEQKANAQAAPKRRTIRAKRVNGELHAEISEMDDAGNITNTRPAKVSRQNGELVGEM